jgi:hypothetical protein
MPANSGYCSPGFSFAGQLQLNFKPNMQTLNANVVS